MKTAIEMAREVGSPAPKSLCGRTDYLVITPDELERFAELVRADEREQIAQMIQDAPPLVEFAQNEHGGCLMCGFTPRLAADHIRARSNT